MKSFVTFMLVTSSNMSDDLFFSVELHPSLGENLCP